MGGSSRYFVYMYGVVCTRQALPADRQPLEMQACNKLKVGSCTICSECDITIASCRVS
jgi:hypothetical protein